MVLAAKYHEDYYYDNVFYSKVGGISCGELNKLESEMLLRLDFILYISPEVFEQFVVDLNSCTPGRIICPMCGTNHSTVFEKGCTCMFPRISSQSSIKTIPSSSDLSKENSGDQ